MEDPEPSIEEIDSLVAALMKSVGLKDNSAARKSYSAVLAQNVTSYDMPKSLTSTLIEKMEANAVDPAAFKSKYDSLKRKVNFFKNNIYIRENNYVILINIL